jgi:methionine-gamma-lyase
MLSISSGTALRVSQGCDLSSQLRDARKAGIRFVESTWLAVLAVSLGRVETLVEHPASMSHSLLSDDKLGRAGIPPGLTRLSVGIEYPDDLIADLQQALDDCTGG